MARAPRLLARPAVRAYHENIIDHYESPRNVGSLDKNDPSVGTGLGGAPACGDVMKLQMSIKDGKVENAVFKVSIRPPSRPAVATPVPAAASKSAPHRTRTACPPLLADVWVRLGDRQLIVRHRVAEGQDYRRVRLHPELRHRLLPQAAPGESALLNVRAVPPRARPARPLPTRPPHPPCPTRPPYLPTTPTTPVTPPARCAPRAAPRTPRTPNNALASHPARLTRPVQARRGRGQDGDQGLPVQAGGARCGGGGGGGRMNL